MAETKKRPTITNAAGYEEAKEAAQQGQSAIQGNATGLRVGAIVLWVLAFVFEVLAVLIVFGKLNISFMPTMWALIILIVLDLACVVIGSQLWKKANHIRPASRKNAFTFWLWNNMGVVVACIAFVPIIVIMLTNKDLDKKTKVIAVVAAIIALLIGGVASYDFNPVSLEEQTAAINAIDGTVYWSRFGKVYHTHDDCQALNRTEELTYGSVEQAIAAGRTRLCKFCANRDDITDVVTDGRVEEAVIDTVDDAA